MPTQKVCTICQTSPAMGFGTGKMKSTCTGCIASLIAEGTCPACRGVETYTTEHIAVCDGKLPKVPKGAQGSKGSSKGSTTKTAHQIGVEAEANKRSEERRVRVLTVKEATDLVALCESNLKALTDSGTATEKQVINAQKKVADAKAKLVAAKAVPDGRCPTCNCLLSDRGKCVNEECADAA